MFLGTSNSISFIASKRQQIIACYDRGKAVVSCEKVDAAAYPSGVAAF